MSRDANSPPMDTLRFVQFPHPGPEPACRDGDWVHWNRSGSHSRKCLRSPGRWRRSGKLDAVEHDGDIVFWGEWEPPSRAQATENPKDGGRPRFVHTPFWHAVPGKGHFHNTDPYVFGDRFRYSNCRQNSKTGPRATQRLATGSLIVFGSPVNGDFVVDTVFVVGDARRIAPENVGKLRGVDKVFRSVVLDLFYRDGNPGNTYRLYHGATPSAPVGGMFSFFPCLPLTKAPNGFARPSVHLDDLINPTCKQNFKLGNPSSLREVEKLWGRIARQVLDEGLYLGVHAATPAKVPKSYEPPETAGTKGGCGPPPTTCSSSSC